jgi:hypothetical protein
MQKITTAFFLLLLFLIVGGCGPRHPATAQVSGRVTFNGKAVASGQIAFYPEHGRTATGTIDAEGRYRLTTFKSGDGALLGRHRVTVEAVRVTPVADAPKTLEEELKGHGVAGRRSKIEWLVPEKYSKLDMSPLTAEIKSGDNTLNFDLPEGR